LEGKYRVYKFDYFIYISKVMLSVIIKSVNYENTKKYKIQYKNGIELPFKNCPFIVLKLIFTSLYTDSVYE